MTTLAYDGRYLAADSLVTSGNVREQHPYCKIILMNIKGQVGTAPKIHDIIITSSGDYAINGWVEDWMRYTGYKLLPPNITRLNKKLMRENKDDLTFNVFDHHKAMKPDGVDDSQLWVFYRGKLYEMIGLDNGIFTEVPSGLAVGGSGTPFAIAAMVALKGTGKKKAVEAVRVSAQIDTGSGGALVHYVDTKAKNLVIKSEKIS